MNKNNVRIGSPEDDIITGICNHYSDPNSFFVVGATKGNMVDDVHDDIDDDVGTTGDRKINTKTHRKPAMRISTNNPVMV